MKALDDIPETEDEFRRVVAAFLEDTSGDRDPWQYFHDRSGATSELYHEIGRRGWLSVSWPVEEGGSGRSPFFEFVLWDEMAYARAARPPIAAGFIARSIIEHGSPRQKAWLLPGIAAGSLSFALGYSEPEAGSDLTSLRTRAYLDGDHYVVTGEKRWTSDAHHADFLWLICRTGTFESRARGLTLLVVPMCSPGIEVHAIGTLDGHQLNEVHLTEVRVPAENRIGDEGDGWKIVQGALARERHLQLMPGRLRRDFEELADWARAGGFDKSDHVTNRMTILNAWVDAIASTAQTIVGQTAVNEDTAVTAARQKVVGSWLIQEIARLPMEVGDARQLVVGQPFEFMWRESFLETIAGGTAEVMAGMVARRALGLGV